MSGLQHQVLYAVLMLVAGIGIPTFAALNAELGVKLQSIALAATIALSVGTAASLCFLFLSGGVPRLGPVSPVSFYYYLGGLLIVFYILTMTWVAPKFGVGSAVAFVLLGQIIAMATIDHFGLLGALHHPITIQRFAGLFLMTIGVFLAVRR